MASRRKRGPVAFRPRLLAGLAFSLLPAKRSTKLDFCWGFNLIWLFEWSGMSAFGCIAVVRLVVAACYRFLRSSPLNDSASAICGGVIISAPARSAIVRETRKIR